jgi:adenosylhomocysteine nucleosidase
MEAYAIAKVCRRMGVEFECWKYISDMANEDGGDDWSANVAKGEPFYADKFNG